MASVCVCVCASVGVSMYRMYVHLNGCTGAFASSSTKIHSLVLNELESAKLQQGNRKMRHTHTNILTHSQMQSGAAAWQQNIYHDLKDFARGPKSRAQSVYK